MRKSWIIHHRTSCIGCANCVALCPKYWQMSAKDGRAVLINGELIKNNIFKRKLDQEDREVSELVQKICPVKIIKIE
jgi:ferredoxin